MTWPKYILLAWYAVNIIASIAMIGRPRKPLEPAAVAGAAVIIGGLAFLVVIA